MSDASPPRTVGRYRVYEPIAAGGMAAVHFGRLRGAAGFAKTVAVKRLRTELNTEPSYLSMLADEARLTSRIEHPNVVRTLDVVADATELFIVLEYVHGESLARLARKEKERGSRTPPAIAAAVVIDAARGLQAAHEAKGADGRSLELVHRDVSPQNIMVDVHGHARVLDFGVAKARERETLSSESQLKGKLRYMAPEQVHGQATQASDIFALAVVFWELLTGDALFPGPDEASRLAQVLGSRIPKPSERGVAIPSALEDALMRALDRRPEGRVPSAAAFGDAIASAGIAASADEVSRWVKDLAAEALSKREARLRALDTEPTSSPHPIADADSQPPPAHASAPQEQLAPRSRRRSIALALGGVSLLVLAFAIWGVVRASASTSASSLARPASDTPRAAPAASEPPPPSATPSAMPSVPDPTPTVSASASSAPLAPPKTKGVADPTRGRKKQPAASTKSSACDPPYTFDAQGVKVYKRECFSR